MKNYLNNKKFMELLHNSSVHDLNAAVSGVSYLRGKTTEDKFLYSMLTKAVYYVGEEKNARVSGTHFYLDEKDVFSCSKEEILSLVNLDKTLSKAKELRRVAGERQDLFSYKMLHLIVSMCKAYA